MTIPSRAVSSTKNIWIIVTQLPRRQRIDRADGLIRVGRFGRTKALNFFSRRSLLVRVHGVLQAAALAEDVLVGLEVHAAAPEDAVFCGIEVDLEPGSADLKRGYRFCDTDWKKTFFEKEYTCPVCKRDMYSLGSFFARKTTNRNMRLFIPLHFLVLVKNGGNKALSNFRIRPYILIPCRIKMANSLVQQHLHPHIGLSQALQRARTRQRMRPIQQLRPRVHHHDPLLHRHPVWIR